MQTSRVIRIHQVALVVGLEWIPLLGDIAGAAAMARRQGASHQVLSGNPAAALGLASGLSRRTAFWSAATLMAHLHPVGTVVWLLPLDAQSWHVLACHEGVALARADRSYPDRTVACQAIDALRLSYPRLEVIDQSVPAADQAVPAVAGGLTLLAADDLACLRDLARHTGSVPPLQPVRRLRRRVLLAVVLMLLGVGALVRFWTQGATAAMAPLSAQAAWNQALERALAVRPVHGTQGTQQLLAALYRQPAQLAGWALQSLQCEPAANDPSWQCQGEYRRVHHAADNRGLMQASPADWRLDFPSLDRARVRWPLVLAVERPDPRGLPVSRMLTRDWTSALQHVLPAFSKLQVEPSRALVVASPRDASGQELARPAGLPTLATRVLRTQGPLQSASLLAPLAQSVSWRKAALSVVPGAQAGLRTSRLMLHLEGIVYEHR